MLHCAPSRHITVGRESIGPLGARCSNTTLPTLKSYGHCAGVLVYDDAFQATSAGWSPDLSQPNAAQGLPCVVVFFTLV